MKKILLLGLVALFIFVPISLYSYEKQSDNNFDWMPHLTMHDIHQDLKEEWIDEALQKGEISEEEANWYRNHYEEMNDYAQSRRFGCH